MQIEVCNQAYTVARVFPADGHGAVWAIVRDRNGAPSAFAFRCLSDLDRHTLLLSD